MKTVNRWAVSRNALFPLVCSLFLASCGGANPDDHSGARSPPPTGASYTIGGTVSGLQPGNQLMLENNGSDAVTVKADGDFTFTTPIAGNGSYQVAVSAQPAGQTCSVANDHGTDFTANVSNVSVTCVANPVAIGGSVSGLVPGTSVVLVNGAEPVTIGANGPFTFTTPVAYNGSYAITVNTQPPGQICTVANATATAVIANVTDIDVVCSTGMYKIGVTVSGLAAGVSVTLENNGSDPLTISMDGTYEFSVPVAYTGSFAVTVNTRPIGEVCGVSGGSGSNVAADVTGIAIACSPSPGFVYVTSQSANTVSQFRVGTDGGLVPLTPATLPVPASTYPIAIATDPKGRYVYVATYNAPSSISPFAIGPDGTLTPITDSLTHLTSVPTGSIPESIVVDPTGSYVYVASQTGGIWQYAIQPNGALTQMSPASVTTGANPISIAIGATGKFAYVVNETAKTISQYSIGTDGTLTTLLDGGATPLVTPTSGAGVPVFIAVDPMGTYAYVVSSGLGAAINNVVSQYSIGTNGTLSAVVDGGSSPVLAGTGTNPDAMVIDPAGQYAYVANSGASSISQYSIASDGVLTHTSDVSTVGGTAVYLATDPTGKYVYATSDGSVVSQYSVAAGGAVAALTPPSVSGTRAHAIAMTR